MAAPIQEQGKLTPEQKKVALAVLRTGKRLKASNRDLIVALITGIQESGLRNLSYGDADSAGWRQERAMYFPDPRNVKHSAERFFKELKGAPKGTVGAEAQEVQRSAYPSAYQPHVKEAQAILKQLRPLIGGGRQNGSQSLRGQSNKKAISNKLLQLTQQTTTPQVDTQGLKVAALEFIRNRQDPNALLQFVQTKKSFEAAAVPQVSTQVSRIKSSNTITKPKSNGKINSRLPGHPNAAAKSSPGLANFEGTTVAAWIKPYLTFARQHGWKGSVNSGYRSEAEQRRIYDSGVRPAAVPGTSNHEGKAFPRGAVDVSDAPQLAAILKKYPGGSALKYAGSKDPVHFSHPHNGGY